MAKVKYSALLLFTSQLAAMVEAHLPLVRILDGLSKEALSRNLLKILKTVKKDVESGVDFGYAISQHPKVFDAIYVNMVKAGMATGRLDKTLRQLTDYMEKSSSTRGKLKTAFAYPLFMLAFLCLVSFLMVFKILPTFQKMFAAFGDRPLPLPTRMMITSGHFVSNNILWILIGGAAIAAAVIFILKNPYTRFLWDKYKLRLPLVGDLMKKSAMGKFLRAFAVLTQSEVLILDSLNLVAGAGYNKYLESKVNQVASLIERGLSVAGAFLKTGFFPDIIIQMISSGEQTGELGELLESAANFYEDQVEETIRSIVALINPVITIIVGGMIGLMMISVFLPIFELGSAIRG